MPAREELPDTIRRSPKKAQNTWIKAHDSAVEPRRDQARSKRSAFITFVHAATKSFTNFAFASSCA